MIEFTKSYKTADSQVFASISEAQSHELKLLGLNTAVKDTNNIADWIVQNKGAIVDILTTTPNSKPKARSIHGGTKTRKKTVVTDANISAATGVNVVSPDDGNHNF